MLDEPPEPDGDTVQGVEGCWPLRMRAASLAEQAGRLPLPCVLPEEPPLGVCAKADAVPSTSRLAVTRESFFMRISIWGWSPLNVRPLEKDRAHGVTIVWRCRNSPYHANDVHSLDVARGTFAGGMRC